MNIGYGDEDQMRKTFVERFRHMADYEIVVVSTERCVTNEAQSHYLTRSIRRVGAMKTLLVANRSDVSTLCSMDLVCTDQTSAINV